ncbi:hypothetical protein EYF80_032125 [Liparis tanakae]|uniref:Uncharacterized protein n=1 Tax=Liparis tanakae TaxID=230148 RepID=A0A4Z2GY13_9TELE|nr:hypothetical protein EYF80_032125 [Liparis tanakae]
MLLVCLQLPQCGLHLHARAEGPAGLARPLHLAVRRGPSLVASCVTSSTRSLLRAAGVTAAPSLERNRRSDIEEKVSNKYPGTKMSHGIEIRVCISAAHCTPYGAKALKRSPAPTHLALWRQQLVGGLLVQAEVVWQRGG